MPDTESLTVSQLNGLIKEVLNMGFPSGVWVCGEIQGYDRNRDKSHIFFELCEKDPVSKDILARIGLVIFSGRKPFIQQTLRSAENAFELKDDIEVKFFCRVDFYPPHGAVRLIVESIDPFFTLGKIAQEKQKLLEKLRKNGTLDKNKGAVLPDVPLKIGLITSHDSAAYNDFLSELKLSGYSFRVYCRNTLMQGKAAPEDVCRAIDELGGIPGLNAIVVTRGGGSIADLSCFDSEMIAQKIAACRLPVLSGIGHEINITVTDLASHTYQKTPTAIAQFLVGKVNDFLAVIEEKVARIIESAGGQLAEEQQSLKDLARQLQGGMTFYLKEHHQGMARRQELIRQLPARILQATSLKIASQTEGLVKSAQARFKTEHVRLENFGRLIEISHPNHILKRGFSVARGMDGRVVKSIRQVKAEEQVNVQLVDGRFDSIVTEISKGDRT